MGFQPTYGGLVLQDLAMVLGPQADSGPRAR
jgi:hypothetical protein